MFHNTLKNSVIEYENLNGRSNTIRRFVNSIIVGGMMRENHTDGYRRGPPEKLMRKHKLYPLLTPKLTRRLSGTKRPPKTDRTERALVFCDDTNKKDCTERSELHRRACSWDEMEQECSCKSEITREEDENPLTCRD